GCALHARQQDCRDSNDVGTTRRDERKRDPETTLRNHIIWTRARSRISSRRRYSRRHPNERETWQERGQRCRSAKSDLSCHHWFGESARGSETPDETSAQCIVDCRCKGRRAPRARKLSPRTRILMRRLNLTALSSQVCRRRLSKSLLQREIWIDLFGYVRAG